ncbi:unnamed protein product [Brassica napus]|uniref:(rape) hypothetical protein n=1 Tax=Brassica napus TaxID=3708 RepID=A0A816IJF1_BRANA|nr:unnamed protein product [Brassica napus]
MEVIYEGHRRSERFHKLEETRMVKLLCYLIRWCRQEGNKGFTFRVPNPRLNFEQQRGGLGMVNA